MPSAQPSLLARDDTFFGVCQGIADDFGFDPLWLRLALTLLLFFYPVATIGSYAAVGMIVLLSRLLFPDPRAAAVELVSEQEPGAARVAGAQYQLPIAA